MYEICVKRKFSAAHRLVKYKGMCRKLHGHNWEVFVYLQGEKLDSVGLLMDFKEIKKKVDKVLEKLDHNDLNKVSAFKNTNPSSENIAKYLYSQLMKVFNKTPVKLIKITVSENEGNSVSYWE